MRIALAIIFILVAGAGLGYLGYKVMSDSNSLPPILYWEDDEDNTTDDSYMDSLFGFLEGDDETTTSISTQTQYTSTIKIGVADLPAQQQPTETDNGFCKSIYGYIPCFTFDKDDCEDSDGIWDEGPKMCTCPQGYRYDNFTMNRYRCQEIPPQELCGNTDGLWLTALDCDRGFIAATYTCTLLPMEDYLSETCDCHSDARSTLHEKKECLPYLKKNSDGVRDRASYLSCLTSAEVERHGDLVWRDHYGCVDEDDFLTMMWWRLQR